MHSRTYQINDVPKNSNRNSDDKSFKSCICLLLIFLNICVIIIIASMFLKKSDSTESYSENYDVEVLENFEQSSLNPNEKIIQPTSTTETLFTIKRTSTSELSYAENVTKVELVTTEIESTTSNPFKVSSTNTENNYLTEVSSTTEQNDTLEIVNETSNIYITHPMFPTHPMESTSITNESTEKQITTSTEEISITTNVDNGVNNTRIENISVELSTTENNFEAYVSNTTENESTTEITSNNFQNISYTTTELIEANTFIENTSSTTLEPLTKEVVTEPRPTLSYEDYKSSLENSTTTSTTTSERPKLTTQSTTTENMIRPTKPVRFTTSVLPPPIQKRAKVCTTSLCKTTAAKILYRVNPSVDPCEDFYGFACGGPSGSSNIEEDATERMQRIAHIIFMEAARTNGEGRPKAVEVMMDYYVSCVKDGYESSYDDRLIEVRNLLKDMNLLQILSPGTKDGEVDITLLFEQMILIQLLPIFDVNVALGFERESEYRLELTPPSLFTTSLDSNSVPAPPPPPPPPAMSAQHLLLHERCLSDLAERVQNLQNTARLSFNGSFYSGAQDRVECVRKYRRAGPYAARLRNVSRLLLEEPHSEQFEGFGKIVEDLVELSDFMDQIFLNTTQSDTYSANSKVCVYELEIKFPAIKWAELFSKLTTKAFHQNTDIYLKFPKMLEEIFEYLQKWPSYKIYNAFLVSFAMDLYMNLVEPPVSSASRRTKCQLEALSIFPPVASSIYLKTVKRREIDSMEELLDDLFTELRMNLTASLQKAYWLDERSSTSCVSALEELTIITANDEYGPNENQLNDMYKDVTIIGNHQRDFVEMISLHRKLKFGLHSRKFDIQYINGFMMNSYDVLPISIFSENVIVFPAGTLDIYNPIDMHDISIRFLAMAKIGMHIALQLGKRFDPIGINQGIKLSTVSKPSYDSLKSTVFDMFAFTMTRTINKHVVDFKVNSMASRNTRISDNIAFRLISDVFPSFQEITILPWLNEIYTNKQIYIIATMQEFCKRETITQYLLEIKESSVLPPTLRVENMVTNSEDFAEAFSCPVGSTMNSPIKLQFPYIEKIDDDYLFEYTNIDNANLL